MRVHNEILKTLINNASHFGIDEMEIYKDTGLNAGTLNEAEGMQDWSAGIKVWESILQRSNYRQISLNFGKRITFSVLGWISPLVSSSSDLLTAWKSIVNFFPLMGDMFEYHLLELSDGSVKIVYKPSATWVEKSSVTAAMAVEHAMSLTLAISGFLVGQKITPLKANFTYGVKPSDRSFYQDIFGNVSFGENENSLHFSKETSETKTVSGNQLTYEFMLKLCSEKLSGVQRSAGYYSKVKRILFNKESYYNLKIEEVAAMLNTSTRTLQRNLKEEGYTYQSILDEHLVDSATTLLAKPGVQIQEVAFILGFESAQSFSRAVKKKTGKSPTSLKASIFKD
ncbi:MAG: AraC family transcriptional regulator ligand-binding domain-containing protein [Sporocytophaga sp.]|nr:AraC family transcriptional regulator ligand-binding domain-containing protein [Sporocytophaga sp.]